MKYPARHSLDARNDIVVISRITDWITSSGYAVPKFESNGTWPNVDGTIDLIDSESYPKGSLYAQVKKLPTQNNLRYTFKDEEKFLTYCRDHASWMPILLIGVDLEKNCAYWLHMSEGLLNQLGTSKTIRFNEDQSISVDNSESIRAWYAIVARYASVARARDELERKVSILMRQIESNLIGADKPEFMKLHMFLDEYNKLLDNDFSIVKKVYYPNSWKLGIVYAEYKPDALSYFLYPIQSTVNDVAIKKLNPSIFQPFTTTADGSTWYRQSNPIEVNPHDHAKILVRKSIEDILNYKLLDHSGIVILAREYLFAYVDKYSEQLGLSKKDKYTVNELEEAFINYYPRWLFAAKKALEAQRNNIALSSTLDSGGSNITLHNPHCIVFLDPATRQGIQRQVESQIAAKAAIPVLAITSDKLSAAIFARMLDFVKQKGIERVVRLYKQKDFSLLHGATSAFIWDAYSPAARLYNLKQATTRLQSVYCKIVSNNFPQISRQLALVEPGHRLLYVYDDTENTGPFGIPLGVTIYEIIAEKTQSRKPATFLLASDHKIEIKYINSQHLISIDGEDYKLVMTSNTSFDIWSSDTPLFDMVYEHLERTLDKYFKH
jgi:hypothetical protein